MIDTSNYIRFERVDSVERAEHGLLARLHGEQLRIDVVDDDVVRVKISRGGAFDELPTFAVCVDPLNRPEDSIYGLGEKSGHHNRRGRDFTLWNTDILDPERTKEFIAGRPPDDLRSEHAEVTGNGYEAFARRQFDLVVHGAVGDAVFVDGARLTLDGVS